jgi:DNA invertase Pin-like site-specific DNA recombinase
MIVAIYARKSTEQPGLMDEGKSITRQIAHARDYAMKKGWVVADAHVYADDGISGAEFVKRPALLRLMNALKPHPPFQVLIMSEESRLGRESIETSYLMKQILDAGVRVFFYLDDRERTLDNALDKVLLSLTNFAAEVEREKARQRTYDAMLRKAKAHQVTGGVVYGYDNVEVFSPTFDAEDKRKRLHVVRHINPDQAKVIGRIFELYAAGFGLSRIAKTLNDEGVPPPRQKRHGWAPSCIREMLYRPLYRGEIVWNKTKKLHRGGTKQQRQRPESEWILIPAPELRIVPQELWDKVHGRLKDAHHRFVRGTITGHLFGRSSRQDRDSPYLLSGVGRCTLCEGPLIALTRGHGKKRSRFYGCSYNHKRGSAVCTNAVQLKQELLDQAVLTALADVLDERILEAAVEKAVQRLQVQNKDVAKQRSSLAQQLSEVETRKHRLVDAIARGEAIESLLTQLKAEEHQARLLTEQLRTLSNCEQITSLNRKQLSEELKRRVADIRGLMARHVSQARQMIRKLVPQLDCTPFREGDEKGYRFSGDGCYGQLLSGESSAT